MFMIYEAVDDHLVELPNYKHVHKACTFSIVAGNVQYHFVDVVTIGEGHLSIGMLVLKKLTRWS